MHQGRHVALARGRAQPSSTRKATRGQARVARQRRVSTRGASAAASWPARLGDAGSTGPRAAARNGLRPGACAARRRDAPDWCAHTQGARRAKRQPASCPQRPAPSEQRRAQRRNKWQTKRPFALFLALCAEQQQGNAAKEWQHKRNTKHKRFTAQT